MIYKENNVFDEALERIRMVFDTHDEVIVAMSGGKDSTVVFNLALMIAREKNRLPLKVFWLDQEAEWQSTVDYMDYVMRLPDVKPYWFQIAFDFTNSMSHKENFLRVWDEAREKDWVHPKSDISIHETLHKEQRFHKIYKELQVSIAESENTAVLCGMRIDESPARRLRITAGAAPWHGVSWCSGKYGGKCRQFYPIYDFRHTDIWTAIAKNGWRYNKLYDNQYQFGMAPKDMRCSALIHETAWRNIRCLQAFEPRTYDRFCNRIAGTNAFSHALDTNDVTPKTLPFMFKDWKEYRDYLLVHLVKPEYWDLFRKRWKKQTGEEWYRLHCDECIINDIDGTINANKQIIMNQRGFEAGKKKVNLNDK